MGRYKRQPVSTPAEHTKYANVHPVLQVLLAQVLGNWTALPYRANVELFTGSERELPFRGKRSDSTEHSFVWCFQLHQNEVPMHRDVLKVIPIWQHQIRVKLEASLLEATEDPDDVITREQIEIRHGLSVSLAVPALRRVCVLQPKHIKRR